MYLQCAFLHALLVTGGGANRRPALRTVTLSLSAQPEPDVGSVPLCLPGSGNEWNREKDTTFLLELTYNGARFHGWCGHSNSVVTHLKAAAGRILNGPSELLRVRGVSRLDRGVHARRQLCCCDASALPPFKGRSAAHFRRAFNAILPSSIRVTNVEPDESAEIFMLFSRARREKVYRYLIDTGSMEDPLEMTDNVWYPVLDPAFRASARHAKWELFREAAQAFVGSGPHDFTAFRAVYTGNEAHRNSMNPICCISNVTVSTTERNGNTRVAVTICGDRLESTERPCPLILQHRHYPSI
eukprot:GHVU01217335.1.p1 GENE.GHVU01217335.1~~GHVU01217335.1.p1  ORF type:complete len:299 (-),score=13.79 GHVU01217335.1:64-960(-)